MALSVSHLVPFIVVWRSMRNMSVLSHTEPEFDKQNASAIAKEFISFLRIIAMSNMI